MLINSQKNNTISVFDRGLCYGDGFFETCFCLDGILQNWGYHWNRMQRSADILRIALPEETVFLSDIEKLSTQQNTDLTECVIKIIVTRGIGGRGYSPANCNSASHIVFNSDMPNYQQLRTRGMKASLLNTTLTAEGKIAGLKHLNRLNQVLAKMELDEKGTDEGVVCNVNGYVREGVSSNIFMLRNNTLVTPPLKDCGVAGILRSKVIELAPKICNVDILEEDFTPAELLAAEDIFFTNSLLGVCPVRQMEDRTYTVSDVTQDLINASLERDIA